MSPRHSHDAPTYSDGCVLVLLLILLYQYTPGTVDDNSDGGPASAS
jgi:hypothetical protein